MTLTVIETIGRYLGWCPHAQSLNPSKTARSRYGENLNPDGGRDLPVRKYGWMNRYRTRILAFALCMTGVGFSLFAVANGDKLGMLAIGLTLATLLYMADGFAYWKLFENVREAGIADELDWTQVKVVRVLPVIGVALILGFAGAAFMGLIPGLSMLTVNGFLAGFAAIGWYHLATVILWEKRSGRALYSNQNKIYLTEGADVSS